MRSPISIGELGTTVIAIIFAESFALLIGNLTNWLPGRQVWFAAILFPLAAVGCVRLASLATAIFSGIKLEVECHETKSGILFNLIVINSGRVGLSGLHVSIEGITAEPLSEVDHQYLERQRKANAVKYCRLTAYEDANTTKEREGFDLAIGDRIAVSIAHWRFDGKLYAMISEGDIGRPERFHRAERAAIPIGPYSASLTVYGPTLKLSAASVRFNVTSARIPFIELASDRTQ